VNFLSEISFEGNLLSHDRSTNNLFSTDLSTLGENIEELKFSILFGLKLMLSFFYIRMFRFRDPPKLNEVNSSTSSLLALSSLRVLLRKSLETALRLIFVSKLSIVYDSIFLISSF